ncbi:MAG TPA: MFS transporter [Gemmatimonadales bacterium]|nr:MFS transporter [Gemmatimonadales bacterium]
MTEHRRDPYAEKFGAYRWYALGLLAFINLLNYLDRNVIFALFEPIKRDLHLSDTQLGWLGSAYILVFSLAALPLGVLSDIRSRRAVIAGGVAIWSAFTSLGGIVRNYWQLFVCRSAVGLGEAAFGPASASLVADYFPGRRRAFAMGLLSSGVAIGGVLGILLGGQLEALYGWRVAFMLVGIPGLICASLAARLRDPTRTYARIGLRAHIRKVEIGVVAVVRYAWPLLLGTIAGIGAAFWLQTRQGPDATVDLAVVGIGVGLGLAGSIIKWVRVVQAPASANVEEAEIAEEMSDAFGEMVHAGRVVLHTPTLVYVFLGGALISFGMNGLVGWGPTFVARELGLSMAQSAVLLGKWGLIAGTAGTLAGGWVADQLRDRFASGRVLTVAIGFVLGVPLAMMGLLERDLQHFVMLFTAAFFFLSWYNGPLTAVIFDVVPARITATVSGVYLLFIHLAGDAIAFPLVGALSDQFGIAQAVLLLPMVSLGGGLVTLIATRTVGRDMARYPT